MDRDRTYCERVLQHPRCSAEHPVAERLHERAPKGRREVGCAAREEEVQELCVLWHVEVPHEIQDAPLHDGPVNEAHRIEVSEHNRRRAEDSLRECGVMCCTGVVSGDELL